MGAYFLKKQARSPILEGFGRNIYALLSFSGQQYKKIAMMEYVVPLEEKQQGVAHRAARYYKFDKKIYNKVRR